MNKVILSGGLAHRLIKLGHYLVDVRAKRENGNESTFVFYVDKWFNDDVTHCMNDKAGDELILKERLKQLCMTEKEYKILIIEDAINYVR